jgi:acetyl esterase/lipase
MVSTRSRAATGAIVVVLLAALACNRPNRPPTGPVVVEDGVRYQQVVFDGTEKLATAETFATAPGASGAMTALKLDMWGPVRDTAAKRPVIVWMFGGAFVGGARSAMSSYAQDSARRGYVGVTIDYRLVTPKANLVEDVRAGAPIAYDDAIAAAEWLKSHAAQYKLDPDAIIAGGFSAGAINAIDTVVLPGTRGPATSPYAAAISNSGASMGAILGGNSSRPGQGPIIMFAGTADTVVKYQDWQKKTCDQHKAAGNVCEWVSYTGQGHGVFGQMTDLYDRSATFVLRNVLVPRGYPAPSAPGSR